MHKFTFLPQELQFAVFGHLKRDSEAIEACSLVCHAWRDLAAPHIFRTICLDNENRYLFFQEVPAILPNILTLVRNLKLVNLSPSHDYATLSVAEVLPRLQWLESLHICLNYPIDCLWDDLPIVTRRAITDVLSISSFTSLVLAGVKFRSILTIQELFSKSPSLKRLRMKCLEFQANPSLIITHSEVTARARLEELTVLWGCLEDEWLCHPLCSLDLSGLRSLCIGGRQPEIRTRLLKIAGPSLEKVHFDGVDMIDCNQAIDLSNNPNLSSIVFHLGAYPFLPQQCPVPMVELTLGTVHPAARLKNLVLGWFADPLLEERNEPPPNIRDFDYGQWRRLAPFFASDPRFSSLQKVKLYLNYQLWDEEDAVPYLEIAITESKMAERGAKVSYEISYIAYE